MSEGAFKQVDYEVAKRTYLRKFRAAGHRVKMTDTGIDWFVQDTPGHNGPGCSRCGFARCWHCQQFPYDAIPKCRDTP